MPFCPACNTQYSAEERFCHLDGAALLPDAPQDPYLGKQVGNYLIESKLGEGGMGVVYKAVHPSLGRSAAIKFLRPGYTRDRDVLGRFFDEARAVNRIKHQNILDVFDLGQTPEGAAYLVAELLEGEDLEHRLARQKRLSFPELRDILSQICDALSAAHEKGIVHRDLKPENIFLCQRDGRDDFVKLVDFGIAKLIEPGGAGPKRTQTGLVIGTPHYMSPEQGAGNKNIDHRSDLYSLGVILYECLSGALPFRAETFAGVVMQHILEPPVPLRRSAPDAGISLALEAVVMRLLAKKPDDRFPDARALGEALQRLELEEKTPDVAPASPRSAPTVVQEQEAISSAPASQDAPLARPPDSAPLATATLPARAYVPSPDQADGCESGWYGTPAVRKAEGGGVPGGTPTRVATGNDADDPEAPRSATERGGHIRPAPLPWESTKTRAQKGDERRKNLRTLALLIAPALLLLLFGLLWGVDKAPSFGDGELFPTRDGGAKPAAKGAPPAPRRPRECQELFALVCDCEPLREKNCEAVPRQIAEIEEQLLSTELSPKEVEKRLKESCKDTLRSVRRLSERFGCEKD